MEHLIVIVFDNSEDFLAEKVWRYRAWVHGRESMATPATHLGPLSNIETCGLRKQKQKWASLVKHCCNRRPHSSDRMYARAIDI